MAELRMGVIGLGNFGTVHAQVLHQTPEANLVAVCDVDGERAQVVAARFGVPHWYTDYRDLLRRSDIDAVNIVTTVAQHAEITLAALQAGKHVFVEKPAALDLEGHDQIIQEAERRGLTVLVGYIRRYDTRFTMLKEQLERAELGDVVAIYSRRNCGHQILSTARYAGTTIPLIIEPGIHAMDLLIWFGGAPARRVYAVERHLLGLPIADTYLATVTLADGVVGTIEQVYFLPERAPMVMDACLEVIGRRGTAQITDPDPGFSIWGEAGTGFPNAMLRAEVYGQIHGALTNELVDFVRSVLRGRKPLGASPRDSRAALEMGLAITRSAQTGQPVELQAGA